MLTIPPLPTLNIEGAGQTVVESWSRLTGRLRLRERDTDVMVRVERCAAGRLRDAYPVGAHDVELVLETEHCPKTVAALLRTLVQAVLAADPRCRRVVYAAAVADPMATQAAEAAGFRYVVDVDIRDQQLSLLVHEPPWVTDTHAHLDHVPNT